MVRELAFVGGALLSLAACMADAPLRTELMLVADTNIARVDNIKFEIKGPTGESKTAEAKAGPSAPGPRSLGLLYTGGKLGPFTLSATAFDGDTFVVSRTAQVSFVKGQTLVVPLHLVSSCIQVICAKAGDTCTERGCEASALDASDLAPWRGSPPGLPAQPGAGDGGWVTDAATDMMDAGRTHDASSPGDASHPRDASGLRDAGRDATVSLPDAALTLCDGGIVDLMTDDAHCGECNNACEIPAAELHANNHCVAGRCVPSCQEKWGNCDMMPATGCEADLSTDDDNCRICGRNCVGNRHCIEGVCIK